MRALRSTSFSLAVILTLAPSSQAQTPADEQAPPHVAFVDGVVAIDREDGTEPAAPGAPLVDGDRLTTRRGRVEIAFPDGSVLDIDEDARVELVAPAFLRVTGGRVLLLVAGASDRATAPRFQIDTPTASVRTLMPGEYRVSVAGGLSGAQTELAVLRGTATLAGDRTSVSLRAGERSAVWDTMDPSPPQWFNSARVDAFERWTAARRDERLVSRSSPYLPSELRGYGGTLDRAGTWSYDAPYGYVWYPNVGADWRPYSEGYWSSFPDYGWMWVGTTAWSWPTHHYGRWGHTGARWYWIPGRTFASAWVSWGAAPGYVSWCPLGFDNRPVFSLSVGSPNAWVGWTVLSRDRFGARRDRVRDYALRADRLPLNTPFIAQAPPPAPRARQAEARHSPASEAGRRGDQPFASRDRGSAPWYAAPPNNDRGREGRPWTAVPRNEPGSSDRANGSWAPPRDGPRAGPVPGTPRGGDSAQVDPFTMGPSRRPAPGTTLRAGPPTPAQPVVPARPGRPRDGVYRGSPQEVGPSWPAASDTAPPAPRSRRPPDVGPRDERAPDSYQTLPPRWREQRSAPPTPSAAPPTVRGQEAQEPRPGPWGDNGRAQARPRDGAGGRNAGSGQAPDGASDGSTGSRGSRRPH
jgi:hypothetical protein